MISGTHTPPIRALGRAGAGGVILFALFLSLTACGGSSQQDAPEATAPIVTPAQTQTLILMHGLGFVCRSPDGTPAKSLYCWASEAQALTDGNATAAGLGITSVNPQAVFVAPGSLEIVTIHIYDHGLCAVFTNSAGQQCFGDWGTHTENTYAEAVTCEVTSADSFHCPVRDFTFAGLWPHTGYDYMLKRWPHSPTWHLVRSAA